MMTATAAPSKLTEYVDAEENMRCETTFGIESRISYVCV